MINAYLKNKLLENLEDNLNKLQVDIDFIFNFTSNWMSYIPDEIKSAKRINEIFLPGTHNTCAAQILWNEKPLCMARTQFLGSKLPIIRSTVKNIVLNQTKTIVEQVQAGIRLFDLRLAINEQNKLYVSHTYYVCELEQCLNEFKYCLGCYSNEIFVINFKIDFPFKNLFKKEDLKSVHDLFSSILGSFIFPSRQPLETMESLVRKGKRLIVYCNLDNKFLIENNEFLQSNNLFRIQQSHEIWPNEDNLDNVVQKLTNCLDSLNSSINEFVYFSFNTTPKFKLSTLNMSIINPSENEVKIKEKAYKKFLQDVCLKHIG